MPWRDDGLEYIYDTIRENAFDAPEHPSSVGDRFLGVLEIPYQAFPGTYQRTNTVPAECPNAAIVWVNSIDQLVRAGTSWYELVRAGTSWYELVRPAFRVFASPRAARLERRAARAR